MIELLRLLVEYDVIISLLILTLILSLQLWCSRLEIKRLKEEMDKAIKDYKHFQLYIARFQYPEWVEKDWIECWQVQREKRKNEDIIEYNEILSDDEINELRMTYKNVPLIWRQPADEITDHE